MEDLRTPRDEPEIPDPGWLKRLGQWLRPYRGQITISLLLAMVGQGLLAVVPLVQQIIIDDVLPGGGVHLYRWIGVLLILGVTTFVAHAVRRYVGSRVAVDVQHDLRLAVHRHLHTLDARRYSELAAGDVISRSTTDLTLIQIFISQVPLFAANLTLLIVGLIVMAVLSPVLFAVVAVSVPVLAFVTLRLRRDLYPAAFSDQVQLGQVSSAVAEEIGGVHLVRAFAREDRQRRRFTDRAATLFGSRMRTARISARWGAAMAAIPGFTQLAVLAVGGWLAWHSHVTLGVFLAFASYVLQFAAPTRLLAAMVSTTQLARSAARRILMLLGSTPSLASGERELRDPYGTIEITDADLIVDDTMVLRAVNTRIPRGSRVAVVGPSGSGKTMFGLLVGRFYDPDAGRVTIGGDDLREVSLSSIRSAVTMVFDESLLYTGTIADNIAFGRPDATAAQIEAAARAAAAHEFITALPDGYDTETGPHGIALSGGQRQRIALARAFLVDPAVLILDDATSAVDSRTELAILDSLDRLMTGRTTILIAHRPSTVELADHLIVLDGGRITHDGPREDVAASSGFVRGLLDSSDHAEHADPDPLPRAVGDRAPTPACWPTPYADRADADLARVLGLPADVSGDQTARIDPDLRHAVLQLRPPTDRPAPGDDPLISGIDGPDDPRPFSLRGSLRRFRPAIAFCAGLIAVDAATSLAAPMAFRFGIDNGLEAGSARVLVLVCLGLLVIQLISWGNSHLLLLRSSLVSERVLFALRCRLFDRLQRLPISYFDQHSAGQIITRLTTDVDAVNQLLQQGLVTSLVSVSTCAGVLVILFALDWRLALTMLVILPALIVAAWIFVRGSQAAYLKARHRISVVTATLAEHLGRVRVTQSFSAEERAAADYAIKSQRYRNARRRTMLYISVFFPLMNLLAIVAKALILIVAGHLIGADALTVGVLVAALLYVDQFFAPLQQLSIVLDLWIQARVATGRMTGLLREPIETEPAAVRPARDAPAPDGPGPRSGQPVDVVFDRVAFGYAGRDVPVIDGVDLHIPAGRTAALVGTTGAGKSTMAKLLLRFYEPDSGEIRIDGRRLTDAEPTGYRRAIGYVPQDPYLFTGTIASNIALGRPDADPELIETAARAVGAHDMIAELPLGYRTPVGPGRSALSAGQQQLVCLARAELVDPTLLILDEATANIDLATEQKVQSALETLARRRTAVLVAHRLSTAARADLVVVMRAGRIVECGDPLTLLATEDSTFRTLHDDFSGSKSHESSDVNLSN